MRPDSLARSPQTPLRRPRSRGRPRMASSRRDPALPMQADQHVVVNTLSFGNTLVRWKVRIRPRSAISCGFRSVERRVRDSAPRRGSDRRKPVTTLKAVVLPAPFGPIRLTISPSPTDKVHVRDRDQAAEVHGDMLDRQRSMPGLRELVITRAPGIALGSAPGPRVSIRHGAQPVASSAGTMPRGNTNRMTISTPP